MEMDIKKRELISRAVMAVGLFAIMFSFYRLNENAGLVEDGLNWRQYKANEQACAVANGTLAFKCEYPLNITIPSRYVEIKGEWNGSSE